MRVITWLIRALLFFVLLSFALKNQHGVTLHGLMDTQWDAPLSVVLLLSLILGCGLGVAAMLPAWWRLKRETRRLTDALPAEERARTAPVPLSDVPAMEHPPRDGL